ncbi:MAG: 4'-phosphopantetheinyl transferase superfamily protein [Terriglobales bacterium]
MIIGLGIDLVANRRLRRELARGEWLATDGIFTAKEIDACNNHKQPAAAYAACFAAKEATLKAFGAGCKDLGRMKEVELEFGHDGRHTVVLHNRLRLESEHLRVRHIRLSVASAKQQTGALVILES